MTKVEKIILLLSKHTQRLPMPAVELVAKSRSPYRVLITTMLSPRTKDEVTRDAACRLFKIYPHASALAHASITRIEQTIYPVGFYRTKARHLRAAAHDIVADFNGKVQNTLEGLLRLKGVGRKIANLVLSLCFAKDAICVDTHVHRISNRLGLIRTLTPLQSEQALMRILPKSSWRQWNTWLVIWGQNICKPISPLCSQCALSNVCPKRSVTKHR